MTSVPISPNWVAQMSPVRLAITGSGGLALADAVHVPFVQEVIAETRAIDEAIPQADVIIELGGEDAKITYLKPTPEQRMNGSCAGGTGAFIDQMSTLLDTDAAGLNEMAKYYQTLYPIASRCGVFAKTDLQPLINDGAASPILPRRSSPPWPRRRLPAWLRAVPFTAPLCSWEARCSS